MSAYIAYKEQNKCLLFALYYVYVHIEAVCCCGPKDYAKALNICVGGLRLTRSLLGPVYIQVQVGCTRWSQTEYKRIYARRICFLGSATIHENRL